MSARAAVMICLVFSGAALHAEDWTQFRGRDRDGVAHETGLLKIFPAGGLKVSWRKPVGWGLTTPVVAGGRVYVMDAELKQPAAKERVLCFAEKTGELLWTFAYEVNYPDWAFVHGNGVGPCATPVVERGEIYVTGSSSEVFCLRAESGGLVWRRNLGKEYTVRVLESRASPLIDGNLLIVAAYGKPGATLVALDKKTGKDVWKALDEGVASSSPVIVNAGGARQLIFWTGASVTSLNPETGEVYWRVPMVTSSNDSISTPVVRGNRLLISGLMMELDPDKPGAKVLWPDNLVGMKRILTHTATPVLQGDFIYSARSNGELVCLEAGTGKQIWEAKTVTKQRNGSAIHLFPCGDLTYLFTDEGDLITSVLSPQGYREISRVHLLEPTTPFLGPKMAWTPPAIANGHIFARNDEEIVCASMMAEPPPLVPRPTRRPSRVPRGAVKSNFQAAKTTNGT
jgi:outer membrane protein assembly factor BamB